MKGSIETNLALSSFIFLLIRVLQTSSSSITVLSTAGWGFISLETPTAGLKKTQYTQLLGVMIGVQCAMSEAGIIRNIFSSDFLHTL